MQAVWDKERQMLTLPEHGIPRPEWERRFCDEVKRATEAGDEVAAAELESWPEADDDWLTVTPESAAAENLGYWTDDDGE